MPSDTPDPADAAANAPAAALPGLPVSGPAVSGPPASGETPPARDAAPAPAAPPLAAPAKPRTRGSHRVLRGVIVIGYDTAGQPVAVGPGGVIALAADEAARLEADGTIERL